MAQTTYPTKEEIATAAAILRRGGLVAFPTETVYGLGANALDREAVRRIFEVKGRPATSPLIVHVDSIAMAAAQVV
ncbi:MAG TPA: Sua5/YciO/YrdC/YwlC family protein, partial [Bryobacteraceae bacterium]|nr:Sua5/YciO/YrdC/YwlC family protein [Bryobacteraceae bacterium]